MPGWAHTRTNRYSPRSSRSISNSCPASIASISRSSAGSTIWPFVETVVFTLGKILSYLAAGQPQAGRQRALFGRARREQCTQHNQAPSVSRCRRFVRAFNSALAPPRIRRGLIQQFRASPPSEEFIALRTRIFATPKVTHALAMEALGAAAALSPQSPHYPELRAPLFILSQADDAFRRRTAERLHAVVAGARLQLFAGAGHSFNSKDPPRSTPRSGQPPRRAEAAARPVRSTSPAALLRLCCGQRSRNQACGGPRRADRTAASAARSVWLQSRAGLVMEHASSRLYAESKNQKMLAIVAALLAHGYAAAISRDISANSKALAGSA